MKTMMKCGHAANASTNSGYPVCAICIGIHEGAVLVAEAPDLTGRQASCTYCKRLAPSENYAMLAFFSHTPHDEVDSYYCGCHGWD